MSDYHYNHRLFKSINLDLFDIEKLSSGIVILKVNVSRFKPEETEKFISTLNLLITEDHTKIVVDFTKTLSLDSVTINGLFQKINEINEKGGSIRFLITEENPTISFSNRKFISGVQLHLTLNTALKKFN